MNPVNRPLTTALVALFALGFGACEATEETEGGDAVETSGTTGGSGGEPEQADVDRCQQACDGLLQFDCLDASTHEACRGVCDERSSSDLEVFAACVDNTLPGCEGCYDNLVDADPVDPTGGGSGGGVGITCEQACEAWLGDGCQPVDDFQSCADFCGSLPETLQDFAVQCFEGRDGCMLPEECVTEEWTEESTGE